MPAFTLSLKENNQKTNWFNQGGSIEKEIYVGQDENPAACHCSDPLVPPVICCFCWYTSKMTFPSRDYNGTKKSNAPSHDVMCPEPVRFFLICFFLFFLFRQIVNIYNAFILQALGIAHLTIFFTFMMIFFFYSPSETSCIFIKNVDLPSFTYLNL